MGVYYSSLGDLKSDGKAQCSSGMRYRNVEFLVSILYYSLAVVQPRKPFVQEISRKKDRTGLSKYGVSVPSIHFPIHFIPIRHACTVPTVRRSTVPVHGTSSDLQHACTAVPRQI